jgi:threonine aldolase
VAGLPVLDFPLDVMSARIDLRSDTATKPTAGMRRAMAEADVGDDMLAEDPTVNRLEQRICELLGKEAAVFACSGTQSNQMGVRVHCLPGDELLIDHTGHVANYEQGAPAALSGVTCRLLPGRNGLLDVPDLEGKIRADNQHFCRTRLVCLENTTNVGGGRVYPLAQVQRICAWAHEHGLKVHLDGARMFNAVIAGGYTARELCAGIDTISICFSKGLGCPMGSVLVGTRDDIAKARRVRKLFGGALRQAGIVAAAALYALDHHVDRLREDHDNAQLFASRIEQVPGIRVDAAGVETNLVFFDVDPECGQAGQLSTKLAQKGVFINATGPQRLRACTHLDISREDALRAAEAISEAMHEGLRSAATAAAGPYSR